MTIVAAYIQLIMLILFIIFCCIATPEDDPKLLFLMIFIPVVFLALTFMP